MEEVVGLAVALAQVVDVACDRVLGDEGLDAVGVEVADELVAEGAVGERGEGLEIELAPLEGRPGVEERASLCAAAP